MGHYTAAASSPFPDVREGAAWYSVDNTCDPPERRPFLLDQVWTLGWLGWG
jgi:hypothetical protein